MDAQEVVGALPQALVPILTLISPYITAFFARPSMNPKFKVVIAALISVVIAVLYVLINGQVNSWATFFTAAPLIFGVQQALYGLFLKDSTKKVEAQTGNTDPVAPTVEVGTTKEGSDAALFVDGVKLSDETVVAESPAKG